MVLDCDVVRRLRKLGAKEAWETIKDLACEEAISIIEHKETLCGIINKKRGHVSLELPHMEAFKGLVLNFILNQEDKIQQLEECIGKIRSDFMQLSLNIVEILKAEIKTKEYEYMSKRLKSTMSNLPTPEKLRRNSFASFLYLKASIIKCDTTTSSTILSTPAPSSFGVFCPVYRELVHEFFATYEMGVGTYRTNPGLYTEARKNKVGMNHALNNGLKDSGPWYDEKSLVAMGILEELEELNMDGAGSSRDAYRSMGRGDWQAHRGAWMDQQDARWGNLDTWMTRQDQRSN
ncbi:hypothetical protein Tco_0594900 [Tanacetum coccineum]